MATSPRADWTSTTRGRRFVFAALYFAEGAPIGLIWWALPVWLREDGASPGEIATLTGLVTWPWALKAIWAPMVDLLRGSRFGLRGWVVMSQVAMVASLLPLVVLGLELPLGLLAALLTLHAFWAATQDASIDTFAVLSVPARERGSMSGSMQVGMLTSRALFGGGAVLFAERFGREAVLWLLLAAIAGPAWIAWRAVHDVRPPRADRRVRLGEYRRAVAQMLRKRQLWAGFAFACLAGIGFEGLTGLAGPLLLDRGASASDVGWLFFIPAVAAMAAGAVVGGIASDRYGRRRWTLIGEASAALIVFGLGYCAFSTTPDEVGVGILSAAFIALYFTIGIATASLYGLLMDLTDPRLAAFQFCIFMAGINLCYVAAARFLGAFVDEWGYGPPVMILAGVSALSLCLLPWLRPDSSVEPQRGLPASAEDSPRGTSRSRRP